MRLIKQITTVIMFTLISLGSAQSQTLPKEVLDSITSQLNNEDANIRQRNIDMTLGSKENPKRSQGVPAKIDVETRQFILKQFGTITVDKNGSHIQRGIGGVSYMGQNSFGNNYNGATYYTYRFEAFVETKPLQGRSSGSQRYNITLDTVLKPNGEINEFKWKSN
jgi:hypothetical protein